MGLLHDGEVIDRDFLKMAVADWLLYKGIKYMVNLEPVKHIRKNKWKDIVLKNEHVKFQTCFRVKNIRS